MEKRILHLTAAAMLAVAGLTSNAQPNWSTVGNAGTNPSTNFLGTTDIKALVFGTKNVERMRIISGGKVGIGITTPEALLNIPVGGNVTLTTTDNFLLGSTNNFNLAFDNNEIQARSNGVGSTLFLNYWGGATWIGSHSGSAIPAVYAGPDGKVAIGNSATQAGYALTINPASAGSGLYINDPGNGSFALGTKSGSTGEGFRMNISSTTNPYAAIRGHTDGNGYGVLAEATGQFGFGVEGYSSQSYGVWGGTGNSSSYAAYFSGNVFTSGSYLGSDEKLKQNIQDFSSGMDIINQLHPKHYQYRQDGNYKLMNLPAGDHYGLIGQEVEKVLPNLIKDTRFEPGRAVPSSESENLKNAETINFKALNYTELIPIMIKGMQEQQALIDQQQQQMQQQQQQINELKQMLQTLTVSNKNFPGSLNNASLQQNTPNPFNQNTTIRCYVPSFAKQAQLIVYSLDGRQLKSFTLNSGANEVNLIAGALPSGQYTYSLLIDGKSIDSKKMILTK
jgi:hypothetical protein